MSPESSISLSEFITCPTRHPICIIFASLEVMLRVSTAMHLSVAYDDITRQLDDNDNYKFSTCPYSTLQEFAIKNEVMVTRQSEIGRGFYIRCTCSSKVLKMFAFITDELDVP